VPALCISWIDASLLAKDGMYKTTRGVTKEMYFTDDGFPVGIAYCLAILKQVRHTSSVLILLYERVVRSVYSCTVLGIGAAHYHSISTL
jgi:hypothetical protein